MDNVHAEAELLLKRNIVFKYNFGFLGEAYISYDEFQNDYTQYKELLEKYFSFKEPFYCNRGKKYYSTDLCETMDLISSIVLDTEIVLNSNISYKNKQYIMFSLTEYMLSSIAKMLGICFAYNTLKNEYYMALKTYLSQLTDYLVCIIFDEDFKVFPSISSDFLEKILCDIQKLNIHDVREYSEMDNILILFVTYFVYSDYLKTQDIIIAPLQGGALIPPFYISMQKYVNSKLKKARTVQYDYVRYSAYDSSHYCEFSLAEQIQKLGNRYPSKCNLILIDDNIGTGRTMRAIKQELSKEFTNITTCVLECRWDTKLHNPNYPAFELNDVDLVTPLCYRYYKTFDEQIAYINSDGKLNDMYSNDKFYRLNMIYDEFDYCAYIDNNCFDYTMKERIFNIYQSFKNILA